MRRVVTYTSDETGASARALACRIVECVRLHEQCEVRVVVKHGDATQLVEALRSGGIRVTVDVASRAASSVLTLEVVVNGDTTVGLCNVAKRVTTGGCGGSAAAPHGYCNVAGEGCASFGRSIVALARERVDNGLHARAASDAMAMIARRVGCDAAVVGSCGHGLATSHSDVDIVVCMRDVASDGVGTRLWTEVCEGDPPLVCALVGLGRLSAITTTKSMGGRVMVKREKGGLERALAQVLAEEGFADARFKRGRRCKEAPTLLRFTHAQTSVKVDIWCEPNATCAVETVAARRTAAVKAEVAREPLILPLHRLLRMAVGHELRVFECYATHKSGPMGGYPVFLLVRRFLEREVRMQGERHVVALRAFVCMQGDAASGAAESVGKLALRLLRELGGMCVTSETKVGEAMGDLVAGCPAIQLGGLGALLLSSVSRRMLDAVQGGAALRALVTQGTEERLALVGGVCDELRVTRGRLSLCSQNMGGGLWG
jgi:hypothetical protein